MRGWARVVAPFFLLLTANIAAAQTTGDGRILLVTGRIEQAEYVGGLLPAEPKGDEPFVDGGDYRIKLAISKVLIGKAPEPDLYLTLTISDAPKGDAYPEIFLLVKQGQNGQFEPIGWDYMADGVCIDRVTARTYGIEKAVQDIEKKYPCKSVF